MFTALILKASQRRPIKESHVRGVDGILALTKKARERGMHVEVVTNIIPTINDDIAELGDIAPGSKTTLARRSPGM